MSTTAESPELVEHYQLPTKKDEAWRYAPHDRLADLTFGLTETSAAPAEARAAVPPIDSPRVVLVNGTLDPGASNLTAIPEGVTFADLASAPAGLVDELRSFDHGAPIDGFSARTEAWAIGGSLIRVDSTGVVLHVVDIADPGLGDATNTAAGRVLVDIAPGASATIVETRLGHGTAPGGSSIRTSIRIGEAGHLDHIVLQHFPSEQVHLAAVEVTQAGGSEYRASSFNLGGGYSRVEFHVRLDGEAATAEVSGLYVGHGKDVLDQQVTIVHAEPNCSSRQRFRGVLDDSSRGVWVGGVEVAPGADGTDSEQENDNLLLSRRAEVDTQPRLEILADEVSCAHGATVGQLDEDALYYLRSRGIPAAEAAALLVDGFVGEILDTVDDDALVSWVSDRIGHRRA